ncbi:uncharacterized protein LOC130367467 [Hyla sarda]|uniref:uncharacterized protein LOC130367467 n=1 Tax=Hyla sarda TaxID=327740 RepID=UPI0024C315E6|nr:uncharacterized protein LOC130367467 [Hyla sarda]
MYHSQSDQVRNILAKHWDILCLDPTLSLYLQPHPSITYKRAPNLRDMLVHSHYGGKQPPKLFGSKGPQWGCKPCGSCVACPNILLSNSFLDSSGIKEYKITHAITCSTVGVIYYATCPCNLVYIGLTSRELKRRVREHVLGIISAKEEEDLSRHTTIPRHFKLQHSCDPTNLQILLSSMDFSVRETAWKAQAVNLFGTGHTSGSDQDALRSNKIILKNLLHKRMKIWWNRSTLEQYLTKNFIPRGLRIQTFPSYGRDDEEFCTKWEEVSTKSSLMYMQLIIELNTRSLSEISLQIDSTTKAIYDVLTPSDLETYKKEMDDMQDSWEKQIQIPLYVFYKFIWR